MTHFSLIHAEYRQIQLNIHTDPIVHPHTFTIFFHLNIGAILHHQKFGGKLPQIWSMMS